MSTPAANVLSPTQTHPDRNSTYTTLYDLIEAISEQVAPDEDQLVTATLVHLINSGQVRFADDPRELQIICR
jgi:hypothetical protein